MPSTVKTLAVDLDGTALSSRGRLEARTIQALQESVEAGIQVVFVSARPLWSIRQLTRDLGGAFAVAAGGAVVADSEGKILRRRRLSGELIGFLDSLLGNHGAALIYDNEHTSRLGDSDAIRVEAELTARTRNMDPWDGRDADKALVIDPPSGLEARLSVRKDLVLVNSHPRYLEVTAEGGDKATATGWLIHLLGIGWAEVCAVGDGDNDVELIRRSGLGAAMGNASENLRAVADVVTASNDDYGLARFIAQLLHTGQGSTTEGDT